MSQTPTDTPRTDAVFIYDPEGNEAELARTLERELTEARAEAEEQARLLGISGSREAKLLAELTEAKEQWRMSSVCREQADQIATLRAQLAALEVDKKRLDWLENQQALIESDNGHQWQSWEVTMDPPGHCDVRAAIDAALKEAKP